MNVEILLTGGAVIVAAADELDKFVLGLNAGVGSVVLLMLVEVNLTLVVILVVVVLVTLGDPLPPSLGE